MRVPRERVLRPSTRKPGSPYKVDTRDIGVGDLLCLTIRDEKAPTARLGVFVFKGRDIAGRQSIHFKAKHKSGGWHISFSPVLPHSVEL